MKHAEVTKADQQFPEKHLQLSSACHWFHRALQHSATVRGTAEILHRMGCEVKVRFCCLINLLSVNLLVCYEIKVNSDEVIKEYFGGQRAGTVTPKLCPGHGREHSLWAAGAEILLSLLQCQLCSCAPSLPPPQVVGAVSARIRFIPGPSSSASWCVFRSRDN